MIFFSFFFVQNIDHDHSVHIRIFSEAVLTCTHDLCFRAKIRKMYTPVKPNFTILKWGIRGSSSHGKGIKWVQ